MDTNKKGILFLNEQNNKNEEEKIEQQKKISDEITLRRSKLTQLISMNQKNLGNLEWATRYLVSWSQSYHNRTIWTFTLDPGQPISCCKNRLWAGLNKNKILISTKIGSELNIANLNK